MWTGIFRTAGPALALGAATAAFAAPQFAAPPAALPPAPHVRQLAGAADRLCQARTAGLGRRPVAFARAGNRLAILARRGEGVPVLMGTLRGRFTAVGEFWCSLFEIDDLDHAILDIIVTAGMRPPAYVQYRGPAVPRAPTGPLRAGRTEHRLVTGAQSGMTRSLFLYRPNAPAGRLAVLLDVDSADSSVFKRVDAMIASHAIAPIILVGISTPADPDQGRANDLRLAEMHMGADPQRYRAFERFVFADLLPDLRREFAPANDPARIAFVGESASASWVVDHATDHGADARMWGAFALPESDHAHLPDRESGEIFMGGGTFDHDYLANGLAVCAAIQRGGGHCRFATVKSGHGQGAWDELIAAMLIDWDRPQRRR
jgi:hypothetical protein